MMNVLHVIWVVLMMSGLAANASPSKSFSQAMAQKTLALQHKKDDQPAAAARAFESAADLGLNFKYAAWQAVEQHLKAEQPAEALRVLQRLAAAGDDSLNHLQSIAKHFDSTSPPWQAIHSQFAANSQVEQTPQTSMAAISTQDVKNFFKAFELSKDQPLAEQIKLYQQHYVDQASAGMVDYFTFKVSGVEAFVGHVEQARPFYQDLKVATANLDALKIKALDALQQMQSYVPDATIPDIYFVVGMHTSAGTASDSGILLGADFIEVNSQNLHLIPSWTAPFLSSPEDKVWVIVHEYMHYLQNTDHHTVLGVALIEGGADYLTELVYGAPQKPMRYTTFGAAHESRVKAEFWRAIDSTDLTRWSGNNGTEFDDDWVPDLAYFIGAKIAAGYVKHSADKTQAVKDLLTLKDPKAITNRSRYFDTEL